MGKLGYRLFIASRTPAHLEQAAQSLRTDGCLVSLHAFDMQNPESIQMLVEEVKKKDVPIEVLINCAGVMYEASNGNDARSEIGSTASVLRSPERNVTDTIAINMIGTWSVTRALAPYLARGARIVNVSSSMASLGEMGPAISATVHPRRASMSSPAPSPMRCEPRRNHGEFGMSGLGQDQHGRARRHPRCCRGCRRHRVGRNPAARGPTGGFFRDGQAIPW